MKKNYPQLFLTIILFSFQAFSEQKLPRNETILQSVEPKAEVVYSFFLNKGDLAIFTLSDYSADIKFVALNSENEVAESTETFDGTDSPVFFANTSGVYNVKISPLNSSSLVLNYRIKLEVISDNQSNKAELISKLLERFYPNSAPGACVLVTQEKQAFLQKCFGKANLGYSLDLNTKSPINLASVSKQFTAYGIWLLASANKLSLNDDVRKHIPELPAYKDVITIEHLISHTSGLYENDFPMALAGYDNAFTPANSEFRFMMNNINVLFKPGERFQYNNAGYVLLAEIISRVSGKPFHSWMEENVFQKLGMNETFVINDFDRIIPHNANSYTQGRDGHYQISPVMFDAVGPGNIATSIEDLTRWITHISQLSDKDELYNKKSLLTSGEGVNYIFGNFYSEFKGKKMISHLGLTAGYRTALLRFPESGTSVALLAINGLWKTYDLASDIAEIMLAGELKLDKEPDYVSEDLSTESQRELDVKDVTAVTTTNLREFSGWYYSEVIDTTFKVTATPKKLFISNFLNHNIELSQAGQNEFKSGLWFVDRVTFNKAPSGEINSLIIKNNRDEAFILFKKVN